MRQEPKIPRNALRAEAVRRQLAGKVEAHGLNHGRGSLGDLIKLGKRISDDRGSFELL